MADFTCDTNYLAPNRFKVSISRKNYPNLQFYAQQVNHPSVDINATEIGYRRVGTVPVPGDTLSFGQLSMDVLMDENMGVYEEMYDWLKRLVNDKLDNTSNDIAIYCDITVSILNSNNNVIRNMKYVNALPTNIGDLLLTATSEEQYIVFPVSFRFDYFNFL